MCVSSGAPFLSIACVMCTGDAAISEPQRRSPVDPVDRRRHPREPLCVSAMLIELDERDVPGVPAECQTLDISRSGIGVQTRRMSPAGRRVWVGLQASSGGRPRWLYGIVRRSSYAEGGEYHVGIEFAAPPSKLKPPLVL
jgi:rRNA maturation protein Nop10